MRAFPISWILSPGADGVERKVMSVPPAASSISAAERLGFPGEGNLGYSLYFLQGEWAEQA
jgi:hypothetical protein